MEEVDKYVSVPVQVLTQLIEKRREYGVKHHFYTFVSLAGCSFDQFVLWPAQITSIDGRQTPFTSPPKRARSKSHELLIEGCDLAVRLVMRKQMMKRMCDLHK